MNKINIFLDDCRLTPQGFNRTYTVEETIDLLKQFEGRIGILSLDNDLGDGLLEGQEVAKWIEEEHFVNGYQLPTKIIPHTMNPIARKNIQTIIDILYRKG